MKLKFDVSHVRIGEPCKVRMGAGWIKGVVVMKHSKSISIRIASGQSITCYDSRNVLKA